MTTKNITNKVGRFTHEKGKLFKYVPTKQGLIKEYQHEMTESDYSIFGAYKEIICIYQDSICTGAQLVSFFCDFNRVRGDNKS